MRKEECSGHFTKNLFSLQIQLQTLLDGAGGSGTAQLLDLLSDLTESERAVALRVFHRALQKVGEAGVRLQTLRDEQLANFENTLYEEIVDGMNVLNGQSAEKKLSVVDGGKLPTRKKELNKTVCFQEARKKRAEVRTLN